MNKIVFFKLKQDSILALWELLIFILLSMIYLYIIVPYFGYMKFKLDFNFSKFVFAVVIVLFFISIGTILKKGMLYTIWHIVLVMQLFPHTLFFFLTNNSFKPLIGSMIFLSVLFLTGFLKINRIKAPNLNIEKNNANMLILLVICILFTLPFFRYFPYINLDNLFLKNIYETRVMFRAIDNWTFLGYLLSPLSRILLPALLIVSYEKRFYPGVILIVCIIGYLFLASGALKSVLFGFFCAIVFYIGRSYYYKLKLFLKFFSIILLGGLVEVWIFNSVHLTDLLLRRLFFVPPFLESYYYDFFNGNHLYYSYSFMSRFIDYPFSEPVTMYVGNYLLNSPGTNANVGLITEGFISLGWVGVFIHSLAISLIFLFFNSLRIDPKYFGIFIAYVYYINNAFFGTLLLTHGLLFLIIFSFLCLRNQNFE